MKEYFITGTDTGVGKTYVAVALARRARALSPDRRVFAYKPIETGCIDGQLGEDQQALAAAAGGWQRAELAGLVSLRQPAAPYVAAAAENLDIDLDAVLRVYRQGRSLPDVGFSLLEGAGGWRVPITQRVDMAGLARMLGAPVVVVARAGLGTINHSLLTLEAVERDGCAVAALILSKRPDDDADFTESNASEIGRRWRGRVIVVSDDLSALDPLL